MFFELHSYFIAVESEVFHRCNQFVQFFHRMLIAGVRLFEHVDSCLVIVVGVKEVLRHDKQIVVPDLFEVRFDVGPESLFN